jgi:hypothetical protein
MLEPGMQVRQAQHSRHMVIVSLHDKQATCVWYERGRMQKKMFPQHQLIVVRGLSGSGMFP